MWRYRSRATITNQVTFTRRHQELVFLFYAVYFIDIASSARTRELINLCTRFVQTTATTMWAAIAELLRVLFFYGVFQFAYQCAQPWSAHRVNVFRTQLQPGQNRIHEWPGKYVSFIHAVWATSVGLGYACNLKEWADVELIVTATSGFLLFEAIRCQRMYNDCRRVHAERREELVMRQYHQMRTQHSSWSRSTLYRNGSAVAADDEAKEIAIVRLPDPKQMWFHHLVTILSLYGFGMNELVQNSVILSYLCGETAIVFQHLLWFVRTMCAERQRTPSFAVWFTVATVLHVLTTLVYLLLRIGLFLFMGVKSILPNLCWTQLSSLCIGLALIVLFVQNVYWCWLICKNGEAFAFCSVKSFDIHLNPNPDSGRRVRARDSPDPRSLHHPERTRRKRQLARRATTTTDVDCEDPDDPETVQLRYRQRLATDGADETGGPILHATI